MADLSRLSATEAISCEGEIIEDEIYFALKRVGLGMSPELDGLTDKLYFRMLHIFALILTFVFSNWFRQWSVFDILSRCVTMLLRKNKDSGQDLDD